MEQYAPAAVMFPRSKLKPWVGNPRDNEATIKGLVESMLQFGFGAPIVARRENSEIIAGHSRYYAAEIVETKHGRSDFANVPVRFMDLTENEAHALALADNKLPEKSKWKDSELAAVLRRLCEEDAALLKSTGFGAWEINAAVEAAMRAEHGRPCPDVGPSDDLVKKWRVKKGLVWDVPSLHVKGAHRVMCGDSTSKSDVDRLLDGARPECILTDPPFDMAGGAVHKVLDFYSDRAVVMTAGKQLAQLLSAPERWEYRLNLVWKHRTPRKGPPNHPLYFHRDVLMLAHPKTKLGWERPAASYGTVVEVEGVEYDASFSRFAGHRTKSCEVFAEFVRGFRWKTWVDPFLGLGTSLLACENMHRQCFGMEVDPKHVAVSLERAQRAGLKPVRAT